MAKINQTALTKGSTTQSYKLEHFGKHGVTIRGDLSGETLTLESSTDNENFADVYFPDSAGTPTLHSITLAAGNKLYTCIYVLPGGHYYRWKMSNGGGTPSGVYVEVDGEAINVIDD